MLLSVTGSWEWVNVKCVALTHGFPVVGGGVFETSEWPCERLQFRSPIVWVLNDRISGQHHARAPAVAGLPELAAFAAECIRRCTVACQICDADLKMQVARPTVCDADRCVFQAEELKLGVDVEAEVLQRPAVVDLLLLLLGASASGADANSVSPSLELCPPKGSMLEEQSMAVIIRLMPSVEIMQAHARKKKLRESLDDISPALFPLLGWLIGGCRTFLRRLAPHEEVAGVGASCQFALTCAVGKEKSFQEHKQAHGSFLAFHGSPLKNWHSILRLGLKNFSTHQKYRLHGASYGNGIYLSEHGGTSLGYCKGAVCSLWSYSALIPDGAAVHCMALCEVVDDKPNFTHSSGVKTKDGPIAGAGSSAVFKAARAGGLSDGLHVVPQEDYVKTTVICLFANEDVTSSTRVLSSSMLKVPFLEAAASSSSSSSS